MKQFFVKTAAYARQNKLRTGIIVFLAVFISIVAIRTLGQNPAISDFQKQNGVRLMPAGDLQKATVGVAAVGEVKALEQVELKSQIPERVNRIYVQIGDAVRKGQLLVSLKSAEPAAFLTQTEANHDAEEARLSELERGTRTEEIAITETKIASASTSLADARIGLKNAIQNAFTTADDTIRNTTDEFYSNPTSPFPQLKFSFDPAIDNDITFERLKIENTLTSWQESLDSISDKNDLTSVLNASRTSLDHVKLFLDKLGSAFNNSSVPNGISVSAFDTWQADVSLARKNINTSISAISLADEKYRLAKSNLELTERELALKTSGATEEQLAIQAARVKSAQASVQSALAQLSKTKIRAPFSGIISSVPVESGELLSPGTAIVSIVNASSLEIKTFVTSEEIKLIEKGARVLIENTQTGTVSRIAPSINPNTKKVEVIITVENPKESGLIAGQFANVKIFIREELVNENLFVLPLTAVKVTSQGAFVMTVSNGIIVELPVELGSVIGENVEIINGLKKNTQIIESVRGHEAGEQIETE